MAREMRFATSFSTGVSGSTFGSSNGVPFRLWVTAINNAGTVVLGVSDQSSAAGVLPLSESTPQSTTACSACTNATVLGRIYTTATQTSKAMRILGYLDWASGLTTAGTYASGPTKIQLMGPGVRKPGDAIQQLYATDSTSTAAGTTTPVETGLLQAITLTSPINLVEVEAVGPVTSTSGSFAAQARIERTSGPTPIGNMAQSYAFAAATPNGLSTATMFAFDLPGTTSVTYAVYVSGNGSAGGAFVWNPLTVSTVMRVKEIQG